MWNLNPFNLCQSMTIYKISQTPTGQKEFFQTHWIVSSSSSRLYPPKKNPLLLSYLLLQEEQHQDRGENISWTHRAKKRSTKNWNVDFQIVKPPTELKAKHEDAANGTLGKKKWCFGDSFHSKNQLQYSENSKKENILKYVLFHCIFCIVGNEKG